MPGSLQILIRPIRARPRSSVAAINAGSSSAGQSRKSLIAALSSGTYSRVGIGNSRRAFSRRNEMISPMQRASRIVGSTVKSQFVLKTKWEPAGLENGHG